MGDLVEERLMTEDCDRADRDLSAPLRVTLGVAVQVLKLDSLDIQRLRGLLFVPFRDDGRVVFLAFRLAEDKPVCLVSEMRKGELLVPLSSVFGGAQTPFLGLIPRLSYGGSWCGRFWGGVAKRTDMQRVNSKLKMVW